MMVNRQNTTGHQLLQHIEDELDYAFIQRVQAEVTQSCALPFAVPVERIPEYILQAAQYFWQTDDLSCEERYYFIPFSAICKETKLNKLVQLPPQILGVHGVYKIQQNLKYGAMGDFSIERMMLSTYSTLGGAGVVGGGFVAGTGTSGYNLTDVITSLYEVDTFNQYLNPPLSYNFNQYSSKLVLLGDLGRSDLLICCNVRCRIQDLYNNIYFFKYVVGLCKRALSMIYGMYEFKLPGGVNINYSKLEEQADKELEEVKEWIEANKATDYFFMPNTL